MKSLNIDSLLKKQTLNLWKSINEKQKRNTTHCRNRQSLSGSNQGPHDFPCVTFSSDMNHIRHACDILCRAVKMWTKFREQYQNLRKHWLINEITFSNDLITLWLSMWNDAQSSLQSLLNRPIVWQISEETSFVWSGFLFVFNQLVL